MSLKNQSNYTRILDEHGLYHPRCGIAAIHLLVRLQSQPMTKDERVNTSRKTSGASSMGVLILAGLAAFDAPAKAYRTTEKGTAWLAALAAKNLMPQPMSKEVAA